MTSRTEERIEYLLFVPVRIFNVAKRFLTTAKASPKQAGAASNATPTAAPPVPRLTQYCVANMVHSQMFGSVKVSFYHHYKAQTIRIVARKQGFIKELLFTPTVAMERCAPFTMDSAVAWVRDVGFKKLGVAVPHPTVMFQEVPPVTRMISAEEVAVTPVKAKAGNTRLTAAAAGSPALSNPMKSRPFTGRIIEIGETTRPGRDGRPPYTTYMIKLRSEGDSLEREFVGEHLSELTEKNALKMGDVIRLQLLGRNKFEVEVNGVTEERYRNEYSLALINQ